MENQREKKQVLIICVNPYIRIEFQDYLMSLLGDYIEFDVAEPSALKQESDFDGYDCVLLSNRRLLQRYPLPVPEKLPRIVCSRTFNHAFLDQIIRIPPGEQVYVVNDELETASSMIGDFEESGITQYRFIPWGPESENPDPAVRYAITVGEPQLVPRHVQNVINIGNRTIDIATINELCFLFQLPVELSNQITREYVFHILKIVKMAGNYYSSYVYSQQLLTAVTSNLPLSIGLLDQEGGIILGNQMFAEDWMISEHQMIGKKFSDCIPGDGDEITFSHTADYHVCNPGGVPYILGVQELSVSGGAPVYLLTGKPDLIQRQEGENPFVENRLSPIERQRNTFMNIITASDKWNQALTCARRLSLYDFPVLIQGEHGTQKKMLANAIHKSSRRRSHPFVSLNQMLSLSNRSLTEILEMADHGTLLVDDIDQLPVRIQDFLIQVLQEGMSFSTDAIRRYDVRVIATTAADLYGLVEAGQFRRNLFFLLNGSSVTTIPLKQRREDIPLLLECFFQNLFRDPQIRLETILSEKLYRFLLNYDYPGNVQELLNLAQHLFTQYAAHPLIMPQLPSYIRDGLPREETRQSALKKEILRVVRDAPKSGRASIQRELERTGFAVSEGKLRGILRELSEEHLILVYRTKGGCEITEEGLALLS